MANTTVDRRSIFTADGNGSAFTVPSSGTRLIAACGTFGSGSLKLQVSLGQRPVDAAEQWKDFTGFTALTADGYGAVLLPQGRYRFVLSGSTNPNLAAVVGD